jgi:ligand-binding sensor domain-containing protein
LIRRCGIFFAALMLAWLPLAASPWQARAQGGAGDLWQTYRDGLASSNVSAVLAARDGSVWFGTDRGANRYNGAWTALSSKDGLPAGRVRAMAQTSDGALWFAMETGGLARRSADGVCCRVWTNAEGLPSDDVRAVLPAVGQPSGLWIGTAKGMAYLDGEHITPVKALAETPIWSLAGNETGIVWAGAEGKGVWTGTVGGAWQQVTGSDSLRGPQYSLWVDADGRIWAGGDNGLLYDDNGTWQHFALLNDDTNLRVFAVLRDAQGGLWVGTEQGCFYDYDGRSGTPLIRLRTQDGLANDRVRAMAFDSDGALWLGTIAGASRYAGNIWQRVRVPDLADQRINALLTDSAHRTWAGTEGHGLAMWDGSQWQHYATNNGLNDDRVVALFEDKDGRVWVGTGRGVGYWIVNSGWRFYDVGDGLPTAPVWSISQDADGTMWFGANTGLSRWTEKDGFQTVSELDGARVNAVHWGKDGALWVGTDQNGLLRLQQGRWQTMTAASADASKPNEPSFKSVVLNGIVEQPDGTLWVGSYDDGLWRYLPGNGGKWEQIESPLASPRILAVDWTEGSLWVGTRGGLTRIDGESAQSYAGLVLPSPEVLAMAHGEAGTYWIGTLNGLVHYRPEKMLPWISVASVNLAVPQNGAVTLDADQPLSVRLVGGDTGTRPEDLRFITDLANANPAASLGTNRRVSSEGLVSYGDLNLVPGVYQITVRARDTAFNYSKPMNVKIVIREPEAKVTLPGGRAVAATTFYPLLALSVLALGSVIVTGALWLRSYRETRQRHTADAARQQSALERHFNPYVSGEPVREPDMFFGRHDMLHKILNALHQNSIMIHGERRIGKTTLLYRLAEELRAADDPEWVFIPVSIDMEGTPEKQFFHFLMDNIYGVLRAYITDMPALRFQTVALGDYSDRDFTADLRVILDALRPVVAPRSVRVVLLMDEMDVVNSYDTIAQQQLRRIFMSSLAQNLGAVVAGIHISKAWDRLESPWYNLFNEIVVEPFSDEDGRQLLIEPVRGSYDWDPEAVNYVLAHSSGRPYRIQQFGLEAVNHMLAKHRRCITVEDVRMAEEVIERSRVD